MILDKLENSHKYKSLHPLFSEAFSFLENSDFKNLSNGRYPIKGDDLFALVEKCQGRPKSEAKLEAHRKYIDIQFVVSGDEIMGHACSTDCHKIATEYNSEKDIEFFIDPVVNWINVLPGSFTIFYPEDAHAPVVGVGERFKVVIKVRI